jgi:hypothetical protein
MKNIVDAGTCWQLQLIRHIADAFINLEGSVKLRPQSPPAYPETPLGGVISGAKPTAQVQTPGHDDGDHNGACTAAAPAPIDCGFLARIHHLQ